MKPRLLRPAITLAAFAVATIAAADEKRNYSQESALERNERSTPRQFVLPSTPAIAGEHVISAQDPRIILRAQLRLIEYGYRPGRPEGTLTATTKAAIYRFQSHHGIRATGRLDETTISALGVEVPK
jgi:hypothetical protein